MNLILKSLLLKTKKTGKGKGKPGVKGARNAAARGSKGSKREARSNPLTLVTRRRMTSMWTRLSLMINHVSSQF